jgi:hypothetical protein
VIEEPPPGRHRLTTPEDPAMLLVDCPLCATAAPFDTDTDELDCPSCDVRLALAAEDRAELPLAA